MINTGNKEFEIMLDRLVDITTMRERLKLKPEYEESLYLQAKYNKYTAQIYSLKDYIRKLYMKKQ